jgi:acetaldehyde dehydrogenase (acetylating)
MWPIIASIASRSIPPAARAGGDLLTEASAPGVIGGFAVELGGLDRTRRIPRSEAAIRQFAVLADAPKS